MDRRFTFSLPVTTTVLAIMFVYLSTIFVFVNRWFGFLSSPGIMNFVAFTAISAMCIFNYVICVFTDPGEVPATYLPDIEIARPVHEVKRKGGDLRFCQKCSHFKPPRAHHCRVCKRCVLRMDHHCIWMNNCVGHANYKPFLVFVVYAVVACFYSLVLLIGSLTNDPLKEEQQSFYSLRTIYALSALLLAPSTVALCVLMGWHTFLVLQNKTTIEFHEGVQSMWLAQKEGPVYKHPYDIGVYENLSLVLGPVICCWIFPTSKHIGDGLRFRTAHDANAPVADGDISNIGILQLPGD